ncbi:MAG: hypothetical protein E7562_03475 [Ruminococcaceae bacterium]|nr:hypothetical protein [Oscillospiraceae bacterium]
MSRKLKIETGKKSEKIRFFSTADELLGSKIFKGCHIELFSNKEMILEGCIGVFEYTDCYIRLNLGKGAIILNGKELDISSFEEKIIVIKGEISSIEFCV